MLALLGLTLIISVCNDTATFAQMAICTLIGSTLIILYVLLSKQWTYQLDFVAPNGKHKRIYAYNLLSKFKAIHDYNKLGYKVEAEWEVMK